MLNKKVLVTGGSGGLGTAVVQEVLLYTNKLFLTYSSQKSKDALQEYIKPDTKLVYADLADESSVGSLFNQTGPVDVLIHLVGGFSMGKTTEYTLNQWQKDFNLNLTTTFLTVKNALTGMVKKNYGRIVTIASKAALEPGAQLSAYSSSKAAVVAFTESVAEEMKGTNITANIVLPSVIDTPSNRKNMGESGADNWVKPQSLAKVICFLASEAAKDMRGAIVPVYGNV